MNHAAPASIAELFGREGVAADTGANHPFLLNDPHSVWRVAAGHVDVFAVPLEEGAPAGRREHLFRVPCGYLLFGMQPRAAVASESRWTRSCSLPRRQVMPRKRLA